MRIAWFRDTDLDADDLLDGTTPMIDELRATHTIDVVVEASAHDFVWQHIHQPWDLCVFELDNTGAHQFIWGYLSNYPGVVLLHSVDVANLRVAMTASCVVVVGDRGLADSLEDRFPDAHVRYAPPSATAQHDPTQRTNDAACNFAVFEQGLQRRASINRAFDRARHAGATFEIVETDTPARMLARCDVVITLGWPPFHTRPTPLLAAMAAGKAVVTAETEARAESPAIDPQTWRPRDLVVAEAPIMVSVDPRDEEHSLMLAIRRLSADATLRSQLGRAARAWWETHATPKHAAAAWTAILQEATTLTPPPRPADWPKQFVVDGTELAHKILREFGVTSDL